MVQNTDQILMWIMWMYLKRSDTTKIIDHFTRGSEINGIQPTLNYDPCKNLAGSSITLVDWKRHIFTGISSLNPHERSSTGQIHEKYWCFLVVPSLSFQTW